MKEKKYTLTISILASNRKDTLPKTLESIKPILDNVSSELIVVDTGCDDELLEVIRKYTDKIIKFKWINDFAAARNAGIDNAQGQWFMFIDDDEWFEDVSQFIEFFNGPEKDRYGYGKYIVRNYDNFEGTSYTDSVAGRVFKLLDGTRFIDAIHERPYRIAGPTKDFTAFAHHYGYVYKNEEEKLAHFKRNLTLIKAQVEKEPNIARHYCHLTQEYNTQKDYEKSLKYSYEGIENADMSITDNRKDIVGLYGTVLWNLANMKKYDEVLKKADEYLKSPYMNMLGEMCIYGFCAIAAYFRDMPQEVFKYVDGFLERHRYLTEHVEERFEMDAILITSSMEESNYVRVAGIGFTQAAELYDEKRVCSYGKLLDFAGQANIVNGEEAAEKLADMMAASKENEIYGQLAQKLVRHKHYLPFILNRIMVIRKENYEGFKNIASILAKTDSKNGYIQYLRIIDAAGNNETDRLMGLYEKAVKDITDIVNIDHEFWQIAKDFNIPLGELIGQQPLYRFMDAIDKWEEEVKLEELVEKWQDFSMTFPESGIHMKYFITKVAEAFLVRKKLDRITIEDLKEEIKKFCPSVINFYRAVYRDEIFQSFPTMLPGVCQAALYFSMLLNEENKDRAIAICGEINKVRPRFRHITDKYVELLKEQ